MKTNKPPLSSLACPIEGCKLYGKTGQGNLKVRKVYGAEKIRYLRCKSCGQEFSERKGTALWNCKLPESKAVAVAEQLSEGSSQAATARLLKVSRESVRRLERCLGRHGRLFHDQQVQGLVCSSLQADERHGYAGSKNRPCWEAELLEPKSRLIVERVQGERNEDLARRLLRGGKARLRDFQDLAFFSDGWECYATLFPQVFGTPYQPKRRGARGRRPRERYRLTRRQAHVQVLKRREGRRVVEVRLRMAHGSRKRIDLELERLGYTTPNTSAIERLNATARRMDAFSVRKTLAFARRPESREHRGDWRMTVYNFARPHRSLRLPLPEPIGRRRYQPRSPAMAAGLTERIWTIREILLHQVFPRPVRDNLT